MKGHGREGVSLQCLAQGSVKVPVCVGICTNAAFFYSSEAVVWAAG